MKETKKSISNQIRSAYKQKKAPRMELIFMILHFISNYFSIDIQQFESCW